MADRAKGDCHANGEPPDGSPNRRLQDLRSRLKRFVRHCLDDRVATRVEASDVVQEAFVEVSSQWQVLSALGGDHLYRLMRKIARSRAIDACRRHVWADRRSVLREQPCDRPSEEHSGATLAEVLAAETTNPGERAGRNEQLRRLQLALEQLPAADRELLVARHLQGHSVEQLAAEYHTSRTVITSRHLRAVKRLRRLLDVGCERSEP